MKTACILPVSLVLLLNCFSQAHAQSNRWLLGEWKGTGITPGSAYSTVFSRILIVKTEYHNRLAGILVQEVPDNKGTRIEKEFTGNFTNNEIKLTPGRTLYVKQPPHGFWADCNACATTSSWITVTNDSIVLTYETRLCGKPCDGITTYARPLSDFDTAVQRKIIHLFAGSAFEKTFKPVTPVIAGNRRAPGTGPTIRYPATTTGVTVPDNRSFSSTTEKEQQASDDTTRHQLSRNNKTIATYNVTGTAIKIELFDNGEIDGDTVTVYHNKKRIIDRRVLGLQPIVYTVEAGAANRVHEFTLVANNLGRIPPNTALMRITAGTKTYEVFASTNLQENASIIIIYSGD